jgi:ketosteroid isomerase-like protein
MKPMRTFAVLLFLSAARLAALTPVSPTAEIQALLHAQVAAWNRGDIPGFMAAYENSAQLRFASGGTITHGWQPTLDRYLKRYPDQAAMGSLAFTIHEVDVLAPDAAIVFGKWELTRAADKPWGLFTLVMKRRPAGWRIVSDHTSSAD